jgi:hypothetical protein
MVFNLKSKTCPEPRRRIQSKRDIADGRATGDTTTLADPTVVAKLKEQYEEE